MPNLSHEACAQFWFEYPDPTIYRVISFMESVETWTLDGDETLEKRIQDLGNELDNITSIDLNKLSSSGEFVQLVSQIKTGRGLRLLQSLDSVHPGSASKIIMHAEETGSDEEDPASFFLKRNIIFERLRLLSRTFSEQRLQLISRALEGEEQ